MIINMKNLSTFLKRTGLSKRLSTIVDEKKKLSTKTHSFSTHKKWFRNTIKTLAGHNSEFKCYLKMKFCTDAYFYEMLCPKINWNLDWALLTED